MPDKRRGTVYMVKERPGYNPGLPGKPVGKISPLEIISKSNHFIGVFPRTDTFRKCLILIRGMVVFNDL
jgi:hypothetical protein